MERESVVAQNFLPRSHIGRAILLVLSVSAIAFAGMFLFALAVGPAGRSWGERLLRVGMGEFFAALFATGWAGLVWAVGAPGWLPAVARRVGQWMAVCLLIPWAIMFGL